MSNDATTPETGTAGQGETPTTATTATETAAAATSTTDVAPTLDTLQATIARLESRVKDVNKESADRRIALEALQAKVTEAERATLSAEERRAAEIADAEKRLNDREAQLRQNIATHAIRAEATALNFIDTDVAMAMVDKSAITYDAEGSPTNIVELLNAVATAKPILIKSPATLVNPAIAATNPNLSAPTLTLEGLRKMPRDEVSKLPRELIDRVLSGQR